MCFGFGYVVGFRLLLLIGCVYAWLVLGCLGWCVLLLIMLVRFGSFDLVGFVVCLLGLVCWVGCVCVDLLLDYCGFVMLDVLVATCLLCCLFTCLVGDT